MTAGQWWNIAYLRRAAATRRQAVIMVVGRRCRKLVRSPRTDADPAGFATMASNAFLLPRFVTFDGVDDDWECRHVRLVFGHAALLVFALDSTRPAAADVRFRVASSISLAITFIQDLIDLSDGAHCYRWWRSNNYFGAPVTFRGSSFIPLSFSGNAGSGGWVTQKGSNCNCVQFRHVQLVIPCLLPSLMTSNCVPEGHCSTQKGSTTNCVQWRLERLVRRRSLLLLMASNCVPKGHCFTQKGSTRNCVWYRLDRPVRWPSLLPLVASNCVPEGHCFNRKEQIATARAVTECHSSSDCRDKRCLVDLRHLRKCKLHD